MNLSNSLKNRIVGILVLLSIVLIFIPALVVLLNTIGKIWNLENIPQITATIAAVGVFLGALLQISSAKYAKETVIQPPDEANE